jgi:predicted small metal-binding protein
MLEFNCGSPVCKTHFSAETKDELLGMVGQHVLVTHRVSAPSKSLVEFVVANCVTEKAS